MKRYSETIENEMRTFYQSLNEKDRRRYAAVEALKLGHGGQVYIARVLGCDRNTIAKGIGELRNRAVASDKDGRIRQAGGGRKRAEDADMRIEANFLTLLADYTAGDPMDDTVRWTSLSPREIANKLSATRERAVGRKIVHVLVTSMVKACKHLGNVMKLETEMPTTDIFQTTLHNASYYVHVLRQEPQGGQTWITYVFQEED